jgi:hypothetical protein
VPFVLVRLRVDPGTYNKKPQNNGLFGHRAWPRRPGPSEGVNERGG